MNPDFYSKLTTKSLACEPFEKQTLKDILASKDIDILKLLDAAYTVRQQYFGNSVKIHILNNIQNGYCPEDCFYCAQSKNSKAPIEQYSIKRNDEILFEAKRAFELGAFRYCMVASGRSLNLSNIQDIAQLIREIKSTYPLEVCLSPGILDKAKLQLLKDAGLDRLNHNINTSKFFYSKICTTHSYDDRIQTIRDAKSIGLQLCSGVIIGMGEGNEDIIEMATTASNFQFESIPVNFYMPIEGTTLKANNTLTPNFCLRVLCLFRLLNPKAEIRIAAGREIHLRHSQILAFYPANSLFLEGYLNAKGTNSLDTLTMLQDGGFTIETDKSFDELFEKLSTSQNASPLNVKDPIELKQFADLHPQTISENKPTTRA